MSGVLRGGASDVPWLDQVWNTHVINWWLSWVLFIIIIIIIFYLWIHSCRQYCRQNENRQPKNHTIKPKNLLLALLHKLDWIKCSYLALFRFPEHQNLRISLQKRFRPLTPLGDPRPLVVQILNTPLLRLTWWWWRSQGGVVEMEKCKMSFCLKPIAGKSSWIRIPIEAESV